MLDPAGKDAVGGGTSMVESAGDGRYVGHAETGQNAVDRAREQLSPYAAVATGAECRSGSSLFRDGPFRCGKSGGCMSPLTPQLLDVPTWPQSRLHDGARIGSTVSYSSGSLSPVMTQCHAGHVEPYAPMNAFGGSGDAVDAALARAASELGVGLRGSHGGHNERLVNRAMELMGVRPSGRSPLAPPQGMSPVQSSISHSCVPRPVSVAENREASMGTGSREEPLSPLGAAFSGKLTNPAPVKTATEAPVSSCAVQPARSDSIGAVFSGCDSEFLVRKGDGRDEREALAALSMRLARVALRTLTLVPRNPVHVLVSAKSNVRLEDVLGVGAEHRRSVKERVVLVQLFLLGVVTCLRVWVITVSLRRFCPQSVDVCLDKRPQHLRVCQ